MSEKEDGCLVEIGKGILYLFGLFLIVNIGIIIFGPLIDEWDETTNQATASARLDVKEEIYRQFGELGVLEQKAGKNLRVYICKENLMKYSFPDRKNPLREIGCTWCDKVGKWHLPKVYFYDVQTGHKLGSYSCVLKYTTLKKQ